MSKSNYNVRASSWGTLFDCAHKFEWETLLKNRGQNSSRAQLGTAIHASTATFDKGRMTGDLVSIDDAAGEFIDALHCPDYDVDWRDGDLRLKEAERIGLTLHSKYCAEVSPHYKFSEVEMDTKPLTIDCDPGNDHGITITLTGTLDRTRVWQHIDGKGISDLKTGKMAVQKGEAKTKGFTAQLGTYELLYEYTSGESLTAPGEIIGPKTSGKLEIASSPVLNAKQQLIGTENEPGLIEFAKDYFKAGRFPPNPQSNLCNPRYCARWDSCNFNN